MSQLTVFTKEGTQKKIMPIKIQNLNNHTFAKAVKPTANIQALNLNTVDEIGDKCRNRSKLLEPGASVEFCAC